jgi:hypothetical protein
MIKQGLGKNRYGSWEEDYKIVTDNNVRAMYI